MTTDPGQGSGAGPAAFEVRKGSRQVLTLSEQQVEGLLHPAELIEALRGGFANLEQGLVQAPGRPEITVPGRGFSLTMSAWQPGAQICVKVVNVFDRNLELGLPNHLALITLFDPDTGSTTCVMDGTYITAIRTAACAVLSVQLLAKPDARVATIVGAGVQAAQHLRLLPLARDIERINVCSLEPQHAQRLADTNEIAVARRDVRAAVAESDIVCLATHSPSPVIEAGWLRTGAHVSSVGYHPPLGELPVQVAAQHSLFVETLDALRPPPVGCSELRGLDPGRATTLGAVVVGAHPGRQRSTEITVYKAMGIAMQDMVAANLAYESALRAGVGTAVPW